MRAVNHKKQLMLFTMLFLAFPLMAGQLSGIVRDEQNQAVAGAKVRVVHESGNPVYDLNTDSGGRFDVNPSVFGAYYVYLLPDQPFSVYEPVCGFYYVHVDEFSSEWLPFSVKTSGLAIDFGKPIGSKNKHSLPDYGRLSLMTHTFDLALSFSSAPVYGHGPVDYIEVEGYWYVDNGTALSVDLADHRDGLSYNGQNVAVNATVDADGRMVLGLSMGSWPYFSSAGEVVVFTFQPDAISRQRIKNHKQVCFCIKEIRLYSGRTKVDSFKPSWCDVPEWNTIRRFGPARELPRIP